MEDHEGGDAVASCDRSSRQRAEPLDERESSDGGPRAAAAERGQRRAGDGAQHAEAVRRHDLDERAGGLERRHPPRHLGVRWRRRARRSERRARADGGRDDRARGASRRGCVRPSGQREALDRRDDRAGRRRPGSGVRRRCARRTRCRVDRRRRRRRRARRASRRSARRPARGGSGRSRANAIIRSHACLGLASRSARAGRRPRRRVVRRRREQLDPDRAGPRRSRAARGRPARASRRGRAGRGRAAGTSSSGSTRAAEIAERPVDTRAGRPVSGTSPTANRRSAAASAGAREQQRVARRAVATGAADHLHVALERVRVVDEARRGARPACRCPCRTRSSRRRPATAAADEGVLHPRALVGLETGVVVLGPQAVTGERPCERSHERRERA